MSSTYNTIQGDMWDLISFRVYGSEKYVGELLDANPQYRGVTAFSAGITLTCPDIKAGTHKVMPPWKR